MARARNIKPAIFKNEILGEADPLLTILFQGLWCLADRDGKLEDRPKRIKAEIFPYRELPDFNGYLTVLAQLGFIERYEAEKQAIIKVLNFTKHQSPHKTEKNSELPDRPAEYTSPDLTVKAPLNNETTTVKESLIPDSLIPDSLYKPEGKVVVKKCKPDKPATNHKATAIALGISEELWDEYLKTRKRKGATNTPLALTTLTNKLKEFAADGHDPSRLVETANESGWKTVYLPKSQGGTNEKPTVAAIARHHATDESWAN